MPGSVTVGLTTRRDDVEPHPTAAVSRAWHHRHEVRSITRSGGVVSRSLDRFGRGGVSVDILRTFCGKLDCGSRRIRGETEEP